MFSMNHLVKQERGDLNYPLPASARCGVITKIIFLQSEAEDCVLTVCTCALVMGTGVCTQAPGVRMPVCVCGGEGESGLVPCDPHSCGRIV